VRLEQRSKRQQKSKQARKNAFLEKEKKNNNKIFFCHEKPGQRNVLKQKISGCSLASPKENWKQIH